MTQRSEYLLKSSPIIALLIVIIFLLLRNHYTPSISDYQKVLKQTQKISQELKELKIKDKKPKDSKPPSIDKSNDEKVNLKEKVEMLEANILPESYVSLHDKKVEEYAKRAKLIMDIASFLIASLTILFVAFTISIGWLSFKKYEQLKEDVDKKIEEKEKVNDRFSKFKEEFKDFESKFTEFEEEKFRNFESVIDENKKRIAESQVFIKDFAGEIFSFTVPHILGILTQSEIITLKMGSYLKDMILECECILFLRHPDKAEKRRAIFTASGLGTERAIPALNNIVNDENEDREIIRLAQRAIFEIEKREKAKES